MGKLYLLTGDIISNSKGMDAIVNAQNKYMINGSGICGAIYRNAGNELLEYCKKTYSNYMEPCEVRITPGFNLNMDIIHSYSPIYREWDNPLDKLIEAYSNLLTSIKNNNYKKIIIPSLGTGIHGYKHEDVAEKVMNLLYEFCLNNDVEIYFINRFVITTNIYLNALLNLYKIGEKDILDMLINEKDCYKDFIEGRDINDLCYYEKLIYKKVIKNKD